MNQPFSNDPMRVPSDQLHQMIGLPLQSKIDLPNESCYNLCFRRPDSGERDDILKSVIEKIDADTQIVGSPERVNVWEEGWLESLTSYRQKRDVPRIEDTLIPKFIRPNQAIRLNGDYAIPLVENFESRMVVAIREIVFKHYFAEVSEFHEFGAGTGHNLLAFCRRFPGIQAYGSDFVGSSVQLIREISTDFRLKLFASLFDMVRPDESYTIGVNAGVFTFGSIEQLAGSFHRFIEFLIARKPAICVHIEPVIELYDPTKLYDWLAVKFQSKRGYTSGLFPFLEQLDLERRIQLIQVKRIGFGSLMMEGYNLIAWRPISK
jgi:hypothetical protein